MPYTEPKPGEVFRRRLPVYLIGVTIGCVMLGIFKWGRSSPQQPPQQQQQAQPQAEPAPANPTPASPAPEP